MSHGPWMTPLSRFEKRLIAGALILAVGACAHKPDVHPEPILAPIEVAIPVASGCVPSNLADAPEYPDTDSALKSAPDAASRYQLLYAGRTVRVGRLGELEPIVAGCPKAPAK